MSRFLNERYSSLQTYTPGEQPKERQYIKLNTNESPFPPSPVALEAARKAAASLQLYPDPECKALTAALAAEYGVEPCQVLCTNGSDDVLNFAFMAFCDEKTPAAFPDITYGFYSVFAEACGISYREIPLREDFSVKAEDYFGLSHTIFIANPNAPTGLTLSPFEVEEILIHNPDHVVVIDEAYVDFGADSCVPLVARYDNLLVTQTFSKSRSMAGARLGFAIGCPDLIRDLNVVKYTINPYCINSMTMAAGIGTLADGEYTRRNVRTVMENREFTKKELEKMGFFVTDSSANFLFARHASVSGGELYRRLKEEGILVRHFSRERISDYCRITIGSKEEMEAFCASVKKILEVVG